MTESKTPYKKGELYEIPFGDLQADPNQPRKYFDSVALQDLVDSIKTHGLLTPILFRVDQEGNLFVVAGERRLRAAKEAGHGTIRAILVEGNHKEIALVENIQREDLTAIELAESVDSIMREHGYTQEELIPIISKAKSTVNDILQLVKLPKEIRDECRNDPKISRQALIDIVKKKKREKGMVTAYKKYKEIEAKKEAKKQAKETSTPKPKVKKTFKTKFTSKFDKIKDFMTRIDLVSIDETVRKDLTVLVQQLKKTADDLLKKIKKVPYFPPSRVTKPKPKKDTPKKKPAKTGTKSKAKKK